MQRSVQVKELLNNIESETGREIQWAVSSLQSGISDVQINVYPPTGEAHVRVVSLPHGLTTAAEYSIRNWFQALARLN